MFGEDRTALGATYIGPKGRFIDVALSQFCACARPVGRRVCTGAFRSGCCGPERVAQGQTLYEAQPLLRPGGPFVVGIRIREGTMRTFTDASMDLRPRQGWST